MRSSKKTGIAAALAALILGALLTGCTPASSTLDAAQVACTDVSGALDSAKADLQTAQTAANKDGVKGTGSPDEVDAQAKVSTTQANVDALSARATECSSGGPNPTSTPTPTDTCSWQMTTADHTNGRWFYEGIAEINSATTPADAAIAAGAWLEKVRTVPSLLSGAAKVFLNKDVDKASLVQQDGCASDSAVDLYSELSLTLANAKSIVPDVVPASAGNTGVQSDTVVFEAGVTGDEAARKAVKIITSDGREIWVIARCGNLAVPGNPGLPEGPTDNGLYPKSSNPADYRQPGDGGAGQDVGVGSRPKSTVTEPASPPAQVESTVTNPATGVTDSVTKGTGTETGGTAPGTSPGAGAGSGTGTGNGGPTTYPSDPPKNEGGSNDGSVGGF